tara:strand:+ start:831 stop:1475 length:645 start_codon:yes stop_codon:yes gene_type:complete
MKIAIMQPYFVPYLGYFQLINEVDIFVFYDDVNFINRGWINRNTITMNNEIKRFTVPLIKSSQNKKINEIDVNWDSKEINKLLKTFRYNLKGKSKAIKIIESIFEDKPKSISDMAIQSIKYFCKELGIKTKFEKSSEIEYKKSEDKLLNLVNICKSKNISNYVNAEGGHKLYTKKDFKANGIDLKFLKGTPSTSILDIIDSKDIKERLLNYETI